MTKPGGGTKAGLAGYPEAVAYAGLWLCVCPWGISADAHRQPTRPRRGKRGRTLTTAGTVVVCVHPFFNLDALDGLTLAAL